MPKYNKLTHKVPIEIPNSSGYDLSHENNFSADPGTLTPCMVDEIYPGDVVTLGVKAQVSLPPAATEFYGRVVAKWETFFVPYRILYGGWQALITHPVQGDIWPTGAGLGQKAKYLPQLALPQSAIGPGSLADYLGYKVRRGAYHERSVVRNCLPFLAYHKIYDDHYRDSRIQAPVFSREYSEEYGFGAKFFDRLPFVTFYGDAPVKLSDEGGQLDCMDGVKAYALRQRNYAKDYFTNATPKPQAGEASRVAFNVEGESASFSIASLRAANSLQQWLERNNLAGYRYSDQIKAQFGVYPADAITDRCLYLGGFTMNVYNKSVYTTSVNDPEGTNNPFGTPGTKFSSPVGVGDSSLINLYKDGKFHATEHGFLMTLFSLVPYAYYDTGCRRYLGRSSVADFPFPLLSGVGDQEIYKYELTDELDLESNEVFGYTQRFAELKIMNDEIHGKLRDGEDLSAFSLKRSFGSDVTLSTSFLQIPRESLDEVFATSNAVSRFGCWTDAYFVYKKSSKFPAYSIPTLGEMKDTHTEIIDNGGKRL